MRLSLTAGGRWVIEWWSQWQGVGPRTWFVSAAEAREWLLTQEMYDEAEEHFGALPGEALVADLAEV